MAAKDITPLNVALIGCGQRGNFIYLPILQKIGCFMNTVAVCDPNDANRKAGIGALGCAGFASLADLVAHKDELDLEAAIVVTPVHTHYAVSCYLSEHGIHSLVETSVASTLAQARVMFDCAEKHGVICRVAEQFFRDPWDRLARKLIDAGLIGDVGRMTNFHAHLGYHNNSRHQVFAGAAPAAVNAVTHTMDVAPYTHGRKKFSSETFRNVSFHFDSGLLITDIAGNIKSPLGRYPRPGVLRDRWGLRHDRAAGVLSLGLHGRAADCA